jgi:hypothetical protein
MSGRDKDGWVGVSVNGVTGSLVGNFFEGRPSPSKLMATALPSSVVDTRGAVYAVCIGDRGSLFRRWVDLEQWRTRFGLEHSEVAIRKFASPDAATAWLTSLSVREVRAWTTEESRGRIAAAADGVTAKCSRTPLETAKYCSQDPSMTMGVPGARVCFETPGVGRSAAVAALPDGPDRDFALRSLELRVTDTHSFPGFGFMLTLPGNTIYAEAKNLTVGPSLRGATSARARLLATYIEALNTDLGSLAVALRVNTMSIYIALRRHLPAWRAQGGLNAKKKPVPDFALLDALGTLVESRSLQLRVSEDAVARIDQTRRVRDAAAGSGSAT